MRQQIERFVKDGYYRNGLVVILLYVIIYGWLMVSADFLPYVMDNNESFSSLWHAINLKTFGVSQSFGLADEAFSPHAAAHPFVHTHQGNFPRIFAYVIYVLGAQSIESQITVTTLTVGICAVLFAYIYVAKVSNHLFALIACVVLMTDYVLFGQWQVVTYRVWHGFFVYSTLLCAHGVVSSKRRIWAVLTTLNYLCLFYFELVFAAYVAIFAGLYTAWLGYKSPRVILKAWLIQGLGAASALGLLCYQLVGYLGWKGFLQDLYFTYVARNEAASNPSLMREIIAFYERHNIAFWYNFEERSGFMTLHAFLKSIFSFNWQIHTPIFAAIVLLLNGGWLIGLVPVNARQRMHQLLGPERDSAVYPMILSVGAFTLAMFFVLFNASAISSAITINHNNIIRAIVSFVGGIIVAAIILRILAIRLEQQRENHRVTWAGISRQILFLSILLASAGFFLRGHVSLFDPELRPLWVEMLNNWLPRFFNYLAIISTVGIASYVGWAGTQRVLGASPKDQLNYIFRYLSCGFVAYTVVYILSPGYIYSGYLHRYVPFLVFFVDVFIAIGLYLVVKTTVRLYEATKKHLAEGMKGTNQHIPESLLELLWPRALFMRVVLYTAMGAAGCLTLFIVAYWVDLQATYIRLLPPNHYAFLKNLALPPYRGTSFAVDNYAAPVAAFTGQWAYDDPYISYGVFAPVGNTYVLKTDHRYLWFADRRKNDDYKIPDYFLCMVPQNLLTVVEMLKAKTNSSSGYPGCETRGIVRVAKERFAGYPKFYVTGIDADGPRMNGFVSWAIVKLSWPSSNSNNEIVSTSHLSPLEGFHAQRVQPDIVILNWRLNIAFDSYSIEMAREGGQFEAIGSIMNPASKYAISDLLPTESYRFRIRGLSNGHFGPYTHSVTK